MNWDVIAARYTLHSIESYEAPQIAIEGLVAGYNSRSLRILAGESEREIIRQEARRLLKKVFEELDITIPDQKEAVHTLAVYYLRQIVDGEVTPYEGARQIGDEIRFEDGVSDQLLILVDSAIEYDYFFQSKISAYGEEEARRMQGDFERGFLEKAQELLNNPHLLISQE